MKQNIENGIKIISGIGIGYILKNLIKTNTPSGTSAIIKGCIVVGGCVASWMIADKSTDYISEQITSAFNFVKDILKKENWRGCNGGDR